MPLIIEDGTGKDNANSYITVDDLRAFCADRGVVIPEGNDAVYTPFIVLATDYLETLETQYAGRYAYPGVQALAWPRKCVYFGGAELPSNQIPQRLKNAQAQLVMLQLQGIPIQTSTPGTGVGYLPSGPDGAIAQQDGRVVIREKVDVIETEYSEKLSASNTPVFPAVMKMLGPLLIDGGGFPFKAIRG